VIGVAATREIVDGATLIEILDHVKLLLVFDVVFVAGGAAVFGSVIDA
jgi:hypothetical protein